MLCPCIFYPCKMIYEPCHVRPFHLLWLCGSTVSNNVSFDGISFVCLCVALWAVVLHLKYAISGAQHPGEKFDMCLNVFENLHGTPHEPKKQSNVTLSTDVFTHFQRKIYTCRFFSVANLQNWWQIVYLAKYYTPLCINWYCFSFRENKTDS